MSFFKFRFKKIYVMLFLIMFSSILVVFYVSKYSLNRLIEYQMNINNKHREKHRIPQIIGHYQGLGTSLNVSQAFLNTNEYNPIKGEGENGEPAVVPNSQILKMQQLFQINRFNLLASDRISMNRTLLDYRNKMCVKQKYSNSLPKTSIIIVFHNEAWSVLLRTVWSVINQSPAHLLQEIILVDDASNRDFLQKELEDYITKLPVLTKVLRLKTREGLVAARLLGSEASTGEVLTFLDAHCECTKGWLEPLLERIKEEPKVAICPVIDIISDDNFSYIKSFEFHWGAFNWDLHFRWFMLGENELRKRKSRISSSFQTPIMAGGLFAINRKYFFDIGSYDKQLKIWGGDNLEMSFRIWTCGGRVEISPCSHVGHLFRKSSPYTFPGGVNEILSSNLMRVADVWMDEWKEFYFKFNKNANDLRSSVNNTDRIELRKSLNCKSFSWYLENIWKEHFFPAKDRFFGRLQLVNVDKINSEYNKYYKFLQELTKVVYFQAQNIEDKWSKLIKYFRKNMQLILEIFPNYPSDYYCLQKPKTNSPANSYGQTFLKKCSNTIETLAEMFVIKSNGQVMTNENLCLDSFRLHTSEYSGESGVPEIQFAKMVICSTKSTQKWTYDTKTLQLKQYDTSHCLEGSDIPHENESVKLYVNKCDENNKYQKWILFPVRWH